jgi:hypothetical protein
VRKGVRDLCWPATRGEWSLEPSSSLLRGDIKYGASTGNYQELRPNNLVFREGIRDLCGKGVRMLSFGRTDLHHEGLRQFKLSWGAAEKTLQYARYDVASKAYFQAKKHRARIPLESTMSKLPLPLLRLIGRVAYRHVG